MKGCRPLSPNEVQSVLRAFSGAFALRDAALLITGIKTGFRISSLLSIRVRDVLQHGKLVNELYVQRANMKGKIEGRSVPLHQEAREALAKWLIELNRQVELTPDSFVFLSRKGANKPISRIQAWRILEAAFQKCNLMGVLGTHSMKKTFADRMYDKLNGDIFKIQVALGNKSIDSVLAYLSFKQDEVHSAILSV